MQQPQEQLQAKKWLFDHSDGKERKANVKACAIRPQGIKAESIKGGSAVKPSWSQNLGYKAERELRAGEPGDPRADDLGGVELWLDQTFLLTDGGLVAKRISNLRVVHEVTSHDKTPPSLLQSRLAEAMRMLQPSKKRSQSSN